MPDSVSGPLESGKDLRILLNVNPRLTLLSSSSQPGSDDAEKAADGVLNLQFDSYNLVGPGSAIRLANDRMTLQQLNEYMSNLSSMGHNFGDVEFSITAKPDAERRITGIDAKGEEMRKQGFVGIEIPRSAGSITELQDAFNSNMARNLEAESTMVDEVEDTRVIYTKGNMMVLGRDGERFDNRFAEDFGIDKQNVVYIGATRGRFV